MCAPNDPAFLKVAELAREAEDDMLAAALTLIVRGNPLPRQVKRILLNAAACMLDAHDAARAAVTSIRR
jgi:hypothetical protein